MNREGSWVIGAFTVVVGVILIIPGIFLGRWIARRSKNGSITVGITRAGALFYGAQTLFLFAGFAFLEIRLFARVGHRILLLLLSDVHFSGQQQGP